MEHFASTNVNRLSRRDFLKVAGAMGLSAAGMSLLEACGVKPATPIPEDTPLETTTIRLYKFPSLCLAPQYLAEDLLKDQGFTDVQYIETTTFDKDMASGKLDIGLLYAVLAISDLDAQAPLTMLSGVHVGCWELFGGEHINTVKDLKGKTTPVAVLGGPQHMFLATIAAYGGLDPNTDINWVVMPVPEQAQALADGKVDAVLAYPANSQAQDLRAKKIGHVIFNSMMDDPWSQYFCCMVTANREFAQKNPVATKRALRALLEASDICAREPARAAQFMIDKGYSKNYDYALEAMQNIPYNRWREYDPEDTVIFYANQLRDVGLIKSNANDIVAKGTDWHFLNEIKQELKG